MNSLSSTITTTRHYDQRFRERVAKKSRRGNVFAALAYANGQSSENVRNNYLRRYLEAKERAHGSEAKIYHGNIYWFVDNVVTTVYPLPPHTESLA